MNKPTDIGFIVAMKEEADSIAVSLGLTSRKTENGAYLTYFSPDERMVILTPGLDSQYQSFGNPVCRVGKVSAAAITTILIERFKPRCIINAGTSGGVASMGMNIGDVVVADEITNHDMRIPLQGYKEYGTRKIPLKQMYKINFLHHSFKIGPVSSGESFSTSPEEWKIIKKSKALVKEMEAAGVMQAVEILNYISPVYVIKSVTDITDEHIHANVSSEEFRKNFVSAMKSLTKILLEVVDHTNEIV